MLFLVLALYSCGSHFETHLPFSFLLRYGFRSETETTNRDRVKWKKYGKTNSIYRDEWFSKKVRNLQPETEDPVGLFDKEDMTDMFGRAMFEKMQLVGR